MRGYRASNMVPEVRLIRSVQTVAVTAATKISVSCSLVKTFSSTSIIRVLN